MTRFVLVHGSGDGGWAWHLVARSLLDRGHEVVAPDLPTDRDDATWADCAEVVRAAAGDAPGPVLVGHSSGGQVVPLAAEACGASLQVFVAGLVPWPGETPEQWFAAVGWADAVAGARRRDGGLTGHPDPLVAYYHDVPAELAAEALARERSTADRLGRTPWPLAELPPVPARFVVTALDRFIPPAVQRRVAADRLGIDQPDEIAAGHCAGLSRPEELAGLLAGYADALPA